MNVRARSDLIWLACGQAATAVGMLIGVRVLTQYMNPASYGGVSLGLGFVTMAMNLSSTPVIQAAMHFYPHSTANHQLGVLSRALLATLQRVALLGLPVLCAGIVVYVAWFDGSVVIPTVLTLLLVSEVYRSLHLSLLNSARRHRRYVAWTVCDGWARPLVATLAIVLFGDSGALALFGYCVASLVVSAIFAPALWPIVVQQPTSPVEPALAETIELQRRMWIYAIPLIPVALVSWFTNLGDRYIVASVLSLSDVGAYAAVYGLASAPFIAICTIAEQAMRPLYQRAVSAGDDIGTSKLLRLWLIGATSAGGIGVLCFVLFHETLGGLLLGPSFRYASTLMPWIAGGYAIRSVGYALERVCYAHGRTRRVLAIQLIGAAAALCSAGIGTWLAGLHGAAMAVPLYFATQLVAAAYFSREWIRHPAAVTHAPAAVLPAFLRATPKDST